MGDPKLSQLNLAKKHRTGTMGGLWLLLPFLFLNSGCVTYFTKQKCKRVNWFEHGRAVALRAARLSSDHLYNECVKVEAEVAHDSADTGWKAGMKEYCSPTKAFDLGSKGLSQDFEFCGAGPSSKIQAAHRDGIKKFCQPASALEFGKNGGVYRNSCTPEQETSWLPAYKKGRQIYITSEIKKTRMAVQDLDIEVRDLESDRYSLGRKLSLIPPSEVSTTTRRYDPVTKTYKEVRTRSEDDETLRRRQQLSREIDQLDSNISRARSDRDRARQKLRNLESELSRL